MNAIDDELRAVEQQRLTLLKTKRLVLRAQRIATSVCTRLSTPRLERVLKVLNSVKKSQKPGSDPAKLSLFSTCYETKSPQPKMPRRDPKKTRSQTGSPRIEEGQTSGLVGSTPQHLEQSGDLVPIIPKGRRASSPPRANRYNFRESTKAKSPSKFKIRYPTPPEPSQSYLSASLLSPVRRTTPQPLLLVLDLNGTLVYRRKGTSHLSRPSLPAFLTHCLAHYRVLIWSSARAENVRPLCRTLFSANGQHEQLVGIWARNTLGLTAEQYREKVQVYKNLEVLWRDESVQASHPDYTGGGRWHQGNTLLLDDNREKARAQPHNLVEIPEYLQTSGKEEGREILAQVVGWIEEARQHADVSSVGRKSPFRVDAGWHWDWTKDTGTSKNAALRYVGPIKEKGQGQDAEDSDEEDGGVTLGMRKLSID